MPYGPGTYDGKVGRPPKKQASKGQPTSREILIAKMRTSGGNKRQT